MKKKEVMVSYTSKVLVQHDAKPRNSNEDISSVEETASHVIRTKKTLRYSPRSEDSMTLRNMRNILIHSSWSVSMYQCQCGLFTIVSVHVLVSVVLFIHYSQCPCTSGLVYSL